MQGRVGPFGAATATPLRWHVLLPGFQSERDVRVGQAMTAPSLLVGLPCLTNCSSCPLPHPHPQPIRIPSASTSHPFETVTSLSPHQTPTCVAFSDPALVASVVIFLFNRSLFSVCLSSLTGGICPPDRPYARDLRNLSTPPLDYLSSTMASKAAHKRVRFGNTTSTLSAY